MRTLAAAAVTGFVALMVASTASAAPSIALFWTGTTGGGVTGSSSIAAAAGDTLTLDVIYTFGAEGTSGWEFSLIGSGVTALSGGECPSGASSGSSSNVGVPGTCFTNFFQTISPLALGVTVAGSDVLNYDAGAIVPLAFIPGTLPLFIGRGVFVAGGPGSVTFGGLQVTGDAGFNTTFHPGIVATIIPEPGTAGLMGLGLMGLAMAGRRRSN